MRKLESFTPQLTVIPLGSARFCLEDGTLFKEHLTKIATGFYVNEKGALFVKVLEILQEFSLPDTAEVRQAIWEEIKRNFGTIPIHEIGDKAQD